MGFLASCYQEHCRSGIWPKVHRPTLLPKRKATSENLHFFWGKVYSHQAKLVTVCQATNYPGQLPKFGDHLKDY